MSSVSCFAVAYARATTHYCGMEEGHDDVQHRCYYCGLRWALDGKKVRTTCRTLKTTIVATTT